MSVFQIRWTFQAPKKRFLGTAGAQICWKWPNMFCFDMNSVHGLFSEWFFVVLPRLRQGISRKTAFCLWGPGKRAFSMVFLPNNSFTGLSFSVFSDALDIYGNRNEVFGHRRCPNLLKMTKKVPFSAGTRRQDRFPSDFKPFFAVSAKAPAGKQRSACGYLENGSFRRYFFLTVAFLG